MGSHCPPGRHTATTETPSRCLTFSRSMGRCWMGSGGVQRTSAWPSSIGTKSRIRCCTRCAARVPMSLSGLTTFCTPSCVRISACGSVRALAQMPGHPNFTSRDAVRMLASMLEPMPTTTRSNSSTDSSRSTSSSVASARTTEVSLPLKRCTVAWSWSMPSTSVSLRMSSRARAPPNRPSPITATASDMPRREMSESWEPNMGLPSGVGRPAAAGCRESAARRRAGAARERVDQPMSGRSLGRPNEGGRRP